MGKGHLVWTRSEDGLTVSVEMHIDDVPKAHIAFDAAALEDNIHMLAAARASMAEAVTPGLEPGARLVTVTDPVWLAEVALEHGGSALALRHPGFGWLSFLLPAKEARALGQTLVAHAEQLEAKGDPHDP